MATPNDSWSRNVSMPLRRIRLPCPRVNYFSILMMPRPSQGSTFLKDCLLELREQNTAADFVSFYEEMLPGVKTVKLIELQKDFIFSKLVSGLQLEARISLEPILRLIAALSGDLKEDFIPFIPRIVNSLVILLKNGGQKDPEIIEQIFTSWSKIMETLRFYLKLDIEGILRDTLELRYYPNDSINEKMSKSMSCFLRISHASQLEKGRKMILSEVAEQPERAARAGLLYYDIFVFQQKR
ncbi:unnamed protein product [Thlaspi arvense]|uniref:Uncharacterized protein n=1 Tax=Thlaspi arvense TaxID=13288 RepID=A0AAU9R5A0_THLAR|nr:unnamed protein product [Thlaspi arvense]